MEPRFTFLHHGVLVSTKRHTHLSGPEKRVNVIRKYFKAAATSCLMSNQ